jgi:glucosamine kinase
LVFPHPLHIRYLIGIDGGGTGTRARLASIDGHVLASAVAGPSALAQGVTQAWDNVAYAIERTFAAACVGDWRRDECALGLGLAGAILPGHRAQFLRAAAGFAQLALESDGYTTLLGAHAGQPGAVVAAGTGSIGEALRRDGTHISIGGWGYPVGDEGSGAWLGMRAMRHAQHVADGRLPGGALAGAVGNVAGTTREALLAWCERAGQHAYAALAPLVFESEAADRFAARLLDDAAHALDAIALALDPDGALPLCVAGTIGIRLRPRLAPAVASRVVEPAGDAIDGALRLIRRQLDAVEKAC